MQNPEWKAQGCIVQGREYSQYFVIIISEKQPLKIVSKKFLKTLDENLEFLKQDKALGMLFSALAFGKRI